MAIFGLALLVSCAVGTYVVSSRMSESAMTGVLVAAGLLAAIIVIGLILALNNFMIIRASAPRYEPPAHNVNVKIPEQRLERGGSYGMLPLPWPVERQLPGPQETDYGYGRMAGPPGYVDVPNYRDLTGNDQELE